uniref:F-box domain-containing protein n=1 Tax=Mycena chlorophos TaxID=658473 RepID=A0ABQ0L802_MYCCL|nr:predicted protein [Mycena chlorophos]
MSPQPRLPLELEREIFEIAASAHPGTVPVLLRVAHRSFEWIEPFLYQTIHLDNRSPALDALRRARLSKPSTFFTDAVRRLVIMSTSEFADLIASCSGTTHLAMVSGDLNAYLTAMPRLVCISASLLAAFPPQHYPTSESIPGSKFAHITHLEVFESLAEDNDARTRLVPLLCTLPVLTHLALNHTPYFPSLDALLAGCLRLRVLCWLTNTVDKARLHAGMLVAWPPFRENLHHRVVMAVYSDWAEGTELPHVGRRTYWDKAEALIERKLSGDVDKTCFVADI